MPCSPDYLERENRVAAFVCVRDIWYRVAVAPMEDAEEEVTEDSLQAEVTGARLTELAALTRLTKTVRVARAICEEMVPAGRLLRSNCRWAVSPLPT